MNTENEFISGKVPSYANEKNGFHSVGMQHFKADETLNSIHRDMSGGQKDNYKRRIELIVKTIIGISLFIIYMWVVMWIILNH